MKNNSIKVLLLDVGGVLMTNGWDHSLRAKAADHFSIELDEMQARHELLFEIFEIDKISFDEYLTKVIFYKKRPFSLQEVKDYIFDAVRPYTEMLDYIKVIKKEYGLKVVILSNEGRDLAVDRVQRFALTEFVDFFIISSFVHYRKPDHDIYRLAIDMVQEQPASILYIDDRKFLVETACSLGLQGIWHEGFESTKEKLQNEFCKKSIDLR